MGPAPLASALDVKRSPPTLLQYPALADEHVAGARHRVEEQRQTVQQLERDGQPSVVARTTLLELEQALAFLKEDRNLLRREIGSA